MAYLGDIIKDLENTFQIKINGKYHTRTEIEGVRFLTAHSGSLGAHDRQQLFVRCENEALPENLPPYILSVGCDVDVPENLSIREQLDIQEVFNTIQGTIYQHFKVKLMREELFFALHSDHGIEGLTQVAHSFLNNPVTVCDTSFCIIAACPYISDFENLEERKGRMYVREANFQNMANQNIIHHIYSSTAPYITRLDNYPYKWVFESIRIRHSVVGYVCVRGSVRDFTEDDIEFIDVLSQMLSVEMQKDSSFSQPTGLEYEYFLTELLEGHYERADYVRKHLIRLGRTETPFYTVMLLKFTDAGSPPRSLKNYYDQILSLLPNCMVFLFHDDLTVFLPARSSRPFSENREQRFEAFLKMNHMRAFISYTYTDITKSHIHYRQIKELSALYQEHGHSPGEDFIYFHDYFLEHLFYCCDDTRVLAASIHPDIRRLLACDRETGSEYGRTLQVYLAYNRNAQAAARELNIHKSTFFYRLGKMEDLFGIQVNDGPTLFAYEYSFRIVRYLGGKYE